MFTYIHTHTQSLSLSLAHLDIRGALVVAYRYTTASGHQTLFLNLDDHIQRVWSSFFRYKAIKGIRQALLWYKLIQITSNPHQRTCSGLNNHIHL